MNEFTRYCFDPATSSDLWEEAIAHGVTKEMPLSELRDIATPEQRIALYLQLLTGQLEVEIPHAAKIPKNELDEEGRMKYRTVYVNSPLYRLLFAVANAAACRLFAHWVHPMCSSYQRHHSTAKAVRRVSQIAQTDPAAWLPKGDGVTMGFKSDISKYFDTVPRCFIMEVLDRIEDEYCGGETDALVEFIRAFYQTDCYYADHRRRELVHEYRSLKQGCAFASFLANVILYPLDERLAALDIAYDRYSDDQIVIGPDWQAALDIIRQHFDAMSREEDGVMRRMSINEKKLQPIRHGEAITFLGYSIRGSEIAMSEGAVRAFADMVRRCCIDKRYKIDRETGRKVWSYPSYRQARRALIMEMYNPFGQFAWAERIFRGINSEHDLVLMSEYTQDALRAAYTGHRHIGGIGYVPTLKEGVMERGTGRNVLANREKLPEIPHWHSVYKMAKAMWTSRAAYDVLLSEMVNH